MADSLRARLQKVANTLLRPRGLHLARADRVFDMTGLLARAAARGLRPATIIDVGASDGIWSLRARQHFPVSQFLLFEPLQERQAALGQLREKIGFHIVTSAAGARSGTISFAIDPELDGSGVAAPGSTNTREVPVETVDSVIASRRLPGPYLLKLDTHGYEVPVLEGASAVLQRTELLVIEAYNFTLAPNCLRFHELCAWLESRGFRCCDLADPMRRPTDGALWQMDLAFAPSSSPLFANNHYS